MLNFECTKQPSIERLKSKEPRKSEKWLMFIDCNVSRVYKYMKMKFLWYFLAGMIIKYYFSRYMIDRWIFFSNINSLIHCFAIICIKNNDFALLLTVRKQFFFLSFYFYYVWTIKLYLIRRCVKYYGSERAKQSFHNEEFEFWVSSIYMSTWMSTFVILNLTYNFSFPPTNENVSYVLRKSLSLNWT